MKALVATIFFLAVQCANCADPVWGFSFRKESLKTLDQFETARDSVRFSDHQQSSIVDRDLRMFDKLNHLRIKIRVFQDSSFNETAVKEMIIVSGSAAGSPFKKISTDDDEIYLNKHGTICVFKVNNIACRIHNTGRNIVQKIPDGKVVRTENFPDYDCVPLAIELISSIREQNVGAVSKRIEASGLGISLTPSALRYGYDADNIGKATLSCEESLPEGAQLFVQSDSLGARQTDGVWSVSRSGNFEGVAEVTVVVLSPALLASRQLFNISCDVNPEWKLIMGLSSAEEQVVIKSLMNEGGIVDKADYDAKFKKRALELARNPERAALRAASEAEREREEKAFRSIKNQRRK